MEGAEGARLSRLAPQARFGYSSGLETTPTPRKAPMRPFPPRKDRRGGRARPPQHARPAAGGRGRTRRSRRAGALVLVAVLVLAVGAPVALARATRGTALHGVTVAGRNVSGMTRGQIAADVEARARDVVAGQQFGHANGVAAHGARAQQKNDFMRDAES